jgi:hypothetical protein
MSDVELGQLVTTMGQNIGMIMTAIGSKDVSTAQAAYIKFMAAAGMIAMQIDELNNATGN